MPIANYQQTDNRQKTLIINIWYKGHIVSSSSLCISFIWQRALWRYYENEWKWLQTDTINR